MIDFTFTEEQDLLRESVKRFAEKEIAPRIPEMVEKKRIPPAIITGLRNMNLLGMTIPEEFGGMGADAVTTAVAVEEIARVDPTASIPVMFLVDNSWSYLVSKLASDNVRENILPKIATGELLTGIASTEPNFGSDVGAMTTVAEKKGDKYVLNGEKAYISLIKDIKEIGGGYVTVAKTDKSKGTNGVSLFYVPHSDEFMEYTTLEEMGREGSTWGSFMMKDYALPEDYMLGPLNGGFKLVHLGFEFARALIAVIAAASATTCIENGIEYMKTRKAFGQPVGKFQGLQFQVADNVARMEAARTIGYKALRMYDMEQREGTVSRFDVSREVAIAKLLSTVWAFDAINDSLQWHGAYGYTKYNHQEIALRAIRSFQLAEGSREVMKTIIAREAFGKEFMRS